jgi:hypothetical protein
MRDDLFARRFLVCGKQRRRLHDLTGLAIAALRHLLGNPCFLQRMLAVRRKTLDRRNLSAGHFGYANLAGANRFAVDVDSAGAARPEPQPNLVPVSFKCSRTTQSKGVSGSASTLAVFPLIVNAVEAMRFLSPESDLVLIDCA